MKACEKERAAAAAGRSPWNDLLRAHAEQCALCADVALVAQRLHEEARVAMAEAEKRLPPAGVIWWKAQILSRQSALAKAVRPIALWERIAWTVGGTSVLGLAVWHGEEIRRALASLQSSWSHLSSLGVAAPTLLHPFLYLSGAVVALVAFLLFVLWSLRVES